MSPSSSWFGTILKWVAKASTALASINILIVGFGGFVASFFLDLVTWIWGESEVVDTVMHRIVNILTLEFASTDWPAHETFGKMLVLINTFLPLKEVIVMAMTLLIYWLCALAYRFVKSCIPTLS